MSKRIHWVTIAITLFLTVCCQTTFGQEETAKEPAENTAVAEKADAPMGIDEQIDAAFSPVADFWEGLVLTSVPVGDKSIPIVLALLVVGASFFTIYFVFINIRRFPLAINVVRGKYDEIERGNANVTTDTVNVNEGDVARTIRDESQHGEVSHFQALATAVSGTVGLGNIGGVALAIAAGGPGATFWMIVCGLLGMSTKFVECTLGVSYRDMDKDGTVYGGPMYYLKKGLGHLGLAPLGNVLAVIFAILCVGASFGGGNAFQSNQATQQLTAMLGVQDMSGSGFVTGLVFAVLVGVVIIGGIKRIATVTEKIVPFMAVLYIAACVIVIVYNIQLVGVAFSQIFSEAFTPRAGLGGMLGVLLVGFQRAAFSNEAGAGSAAIAHSAVRTKYPASEGIVALLEPFIDTVVICTMTALVIIFFNMSNPTVSSDDVQQISFADEADRIAAMEKLEADTLNDNQVIVYGLKDGSGNAIMKNGEGAIGGVGLTSAAFRSVIPWFPYVLTVAIILFAFSTMISWSYYGLQSWKFLFGRSKAADLSFKLLFLAFVVIGASAKLDAVVKFSDAMILALVFPNMLGLFILAPHVKRKLNEYLDAIGVKKFFN
ncbi:MAG: alanine/glycine:cation symporter family protein [Pirellulaceae bacterium]